MGKTTLFNEYLKTEEERESVYGIAKKIKKKNIIPDNNIPLKIDIETFNKKYYPKQEEIINQPTNSNDSNKIVSKNIVADAILDNINDIPGLYEDDNEKFDLGEFIQIEDNKDNKETLNEENQENITPKKKKKKKKKKNRNIEIELSEELKENNIYDTPVEEMNKEEIVNVSHIENSINKKSIETSDIIETEEEDDDIQEECEEDDDLVVSTDLDPFKEYGNFEDYNVTEEDDDFYVDLNNEKDLTIKLSPKEKEEKSEIDSAFDNTIEGFAEKTIESTEKIETKNTEDKSDKTFFNIDLLFDDDE